MRSVRQAVATVADLIRFENRGIDELEVSTSHQQLIANCKRNETDSLCYGISR